MKKFHISMSRYHWDVAVSLSPNRNNFSRGVRVALATVAAHLEQAQRWIAAKYPLDALERTWGGLPDFYGATAGVSLPPQLDELAKSLGAGGNKSSARSRGVFFALEYVLSQHPEINR